MKTTKKNATKLAKTEETKQGINLAPASISTIDAAVTAAASVPAPSGMGTTTQSDNITTVNPPVGGAADPKPRISAADQIKINEWVYNRDYRINNYIAWVKSHFNEIPFDESTLRAALCAVPGMPIDAIEKTVDAAKRASAASIPTINEVYGVMSSNKQLFSRVYGCQLPKLEDVKLYSYTGVPMASVTCTSDAADYVNIVDCPVSFPSIFSIVSCIASIKIWHEFQDNKYRACRAARRQMYDNFEVGVRAGIKLGMSEDEIIMRVKRVISSIEVADIKSYTRLIIAQTNLLNDLYNLDRAIVKMVGWDGVVSRSAAYRKLSNKRYNLSIQINNISELLGGSTC